MANTFTPGTDRATGYVVTSANWNALYGDEGSVDYLGEDQAHYGDTGGGADFRTRFFMQRDDGDDTTVNNNYEDFAGLSLSVTIPAGMTADVLLILTVGAVKASADANSPHIIINWDGANDVLSEAYMSDPRLDREFSMATQSLQAGVTAGTYTAKAQIKITGGAATATYTNAMLTAIVMPT